MSFFAPKMVHNSPFYKGKLMRWRAKRAEKIGCIQGGKAPQAKKIAILARFQRGEMVKKGTLEAFRSSDFL